MDFLKPDFKILTFLEIRKSRKIWLFLAYFQSDRLRSDKALSELHIHYKSLVTRVCYHAGCTEYCKNFTVALKMIDGIDDLSTVCAHCTSNKNQHALMVFNGNRFRHTASSVQVN